MPSRGRAGVPWGFVGFWGVDGAAGWCRPSTGMLAGWTFLTGRVEGSGLRRCRPARGGGVDEFVHGCLFGWGSVAVFSGLQGRWHVWCCWSG